MAKALAVAAKSNKVEQYEIEGWVRTLREAEEIKNDPAKMKLLKPLLKKQIKSLADLKELCCEENMDEDEGMDE